MKKIIFSLAILLVTVPTMAQRVMVDNYDRLKVHFLTPEVSVQEGDYLTLGIEGYLLGGELGAPALPMLNNMLTVPFCEEMTVTVENAVYDTLQLPAGRVMPLQPSRSKSSTGTPSIILDEAVYATDAYYSAPTASVRSLGIGRDRNYSVLTWSPVSVNPVEGMVVVCRSADVTVSYIGSDAGATLKHYDRYHTPAFSLAPTLNMLFTNAKDVRTTAPVRIVVMVPQSLQCSAISEFAAWKRRQGMMVDVVNLAASTTASAIAEQLQQMYDEATDDAPAPTYLVLVGDNAQLPAFASDLSATTVNTLSNYASLSPDHVTDHYFVTWTDDDLPDCYQGRLSATDTATLRAIIEKTLYYEQYQFINDGYLSKAVLVAGVDNGYGNDYWDNAWRCADPTMDYAALMYVNSTNGFNTVYYYKNDDSYAPEGVTVTGSSLSNGVASTLRGYYNGGIGWINYSAHGDWNCWYRPNFTVSHVGQMSNNDMPSFMIGNCCLSNKFDEGVCFGESLLRKGNNAGAIGYIGATNSTFWSEDFYWSVGLRSDISHTMTLIYDNTRKGMYDRLFHTHDEALADQVATAGQILNAGNMSVARADGSSSWASAMTEYYWEIYELMGDPSLMPWMGQAEVLTVSNAVHDGYNLTATLVPGAYAAVLYGDDLQLVSSAFADANGEVELSLPSSSREGYYLSVTAQGYRPYFVGCNDFSVGLDDVDATAVSVSPNPASTVAEVSASGLRQVVVLNMMGQTLETVAASGDRCAIDVTSLPSGFYLLRIESAEGTSVRKLVVK